MNNNHSLAKANEFAKAALQQHVEIEKGNSAGANRAFDTMKDLYRSMADDIERTTILVSLCKHPHAAVRSWAATPLLFFDPKTALATLKPLRREPGIIGFEVDMVLHEWRRGKLGNPFT